jgi:hypothetical protein
MLNISKELKLMDYSSLESADIDEKKTKQKTTQLWLSLQIKTWEQIKQKLYIFIFF